MMKKLLSCILLLTMLIQSGNEAYAASETEHYGFDSLEEYNAYFQGEGADEMPHGFITAEHLSFLGEMRRFQAGASIQDDYQYVYTYYSHEIRVSVRHYRSPDSWKTTTVLDAACFSQYADRPIPSVANEIKTHCVFYRDELTFHYLGGVLETIAWCQNGVYIRIQSESSAGFLHEFYSDSLIGRLLSMDDAVFQAAKAELLAIDNKPRHEYVSKWYFDREQHWKKCECGETGAYAPHTDENQDCKCDICFSNVPKASPTQPTEQFTQPTVSPTQPDASNHATQATEPSFDQDTKKPGGNGLVIGIAVGGVLVICMAAMIAYQFVIRKRRN